MNNPEKISKKIAVCVGKSSLHHVVYICVRMRLAGEGPIIKIHFRNLKKLGEHGFFIFTNLRKFFDMGLVKF